MRTLVVRLDNAGDEATVAASRGGRTVVLPYPPGRSTTEISARWP
jgi:hypothetical protein